jgi:adenylylsulfate kinase-like enzyme
MNEITITVTARAAGGKSTVARLVRNALQATGLHVELDDGGDEVPARSLISRTDALIENGTKITVRTAMAKRQGHA